MASISYRDPTTGQFTPIVGPPGKSAYDSAVEGGYKGTKEEFYKILATIGNVSNPNLLINGDFTKPINQRGQISYEAGANIYTIDRWRTNVGATVTITDNGVSVTSVQGKQWCGIAQFSEIQPQPGQSYTFSAKCGSASGDGWYVDVQQYNISTGATVRGGSSIGTNWRSGLISATLTIPDGESTNGTAFRAFICNNTTTQSTIHLMNAKLELGDHFTGFYPTDPATELAKCQRYYTSSGVPQVSILWNNEYKNSVYFPAAMRTSPTITLTVGNPNAGGIDIIVAGAKGFHWGVNRNAQNQKIVYLQTYIADAEIY